MFDRNGVFCTNGVDFYVCKHNITNTNLSAVSPDFLPSQLTAWQSWLCHEPHKFNNGRHRQQRGICQIKHSHKSNKKETTRSIFHFQKIQMEMCPSPHHAVWRLFCSSLPHKHLTHTIDPTYEHRGGPETLYF